MMRYLTAGESHGPALTGIIEGLPAGIPLELKQINADLARRQGGYGRGGRMQIEKDTADILSGVRFGKTLGSPVTVLVRNRDHANWEKIMGAHAHRTDERAVTCPRPGHADLPGALKYGFDDIRNVLERASARETAVRVALGSIAKQFLARFMVHIASRTVAIGTVATSRTITDTERIESCPVRCGDSAAAKKMMRAIDAAKKKGDTLGGIIEVTAVNLPVGLGSHVQWDRRLDARLAAAVMGVPAIKGVEFGLGFGVAALPGSKVHDPIIRQGRALAYAGNNAGGVLGDQQRRAAGHSCGDEADSDADAPAADGRPENREEGRRGAGTVGHLRGARGGRGTRGGGRSRTGGTLHGKIRRRFAAGDAAQFRTVPGDAVSGLPEQRVQPPDAAANLRAALEVTELALDLRRAWLQQQHPGLSADEVTGLLYREIRQAKEQAWKTC